MNYDIATAMNSQVTYGVLIEQVTSGAPAANAGIKAGTIKTSVDGNTVILGGDIIVAINGDRIRNTDDLSTYLEENTSPGQVISITVIHSNNQSANISVTLGTRPSPSTAGTSS